MPALFIGHGSPMNIVEDNAYTRDLARLAAELPRPDAILVISAHWLTEGSRVLAAEFPRTIHDFLGFPEELYDTTYLSPGAPALAEETARARAWRARPRLDYERLGPEADLAMPTNDHYLPMLYALAMRAPGESLTFTHEGFQNASVSMRCFRVG